MPDQVQHVADMISAPMEQVIVALGTGIARAQRELDRFSIQSQREIDEDPLLSESGLQSTFYQIPTAELTLTMAITMQEEPKPSTAIAAPSVAGTVALSRLKQIYFQPINAAYTNQFSFDVQASSKLTMKIVPVPPPGSESAVTPKMTREAVIQIATPKLTTATDARLSVNFNGQSRTWSVLQYRLEGDLVKRLALVVVDDDTRQIIKSETGS